MSYTKIFKRADGSAIQSLSLADDVHPWTLKAVIWNNRQDFLDTEGAEVFEVLDSDGKRIVEVTRDHFNAGAKQYIVDFVQVPPDRSAWVRTGKTDFVAAWSQPLAMALAKELVSHYPPATGFELVDQLTRRPLEAWDRTHEA